MTFSVLICLYGDYPDLSLRAVHSVVDNANGRIRLYVGMNACGARTIAQVRVLADAGRLDGVIESRRNINKDPMMRLLIEMVDTPFILWMDDDSHMQPGWQEAFERFLGAWADRMDVAGHVHFCHRSGDYDEFCRQRPWFLGDNHWLEPGHAQRVWFATGGLWLARTSFLRLHDFPDRGMVKKMDDLLLGDLISQQHGRLVSFPDEIMKCIKISDAGAYGRRGSGEGADGWRNVNVKTGS
jgi:hypothetical protein